MNPSSHDRAGSPHGAPPGVGVTCCAPPVPGPPSVLPGVVGVMGLVVPGAVGVTVVPGKLELLVVPVPEVAEAPITTQLAVPDTVAPGLVSGTIPGGQVLPVLAAPPVPVPSVVFGTVPGAVFGTVPGAVFGTMPGAVLGKVPVVFGGAVTWAAATAGATASRSAAHSILRLMRDR